MHDCPTCGGACSCDGEDHDQPAPLDCVHDCPVDDDDDEQNFDDEPDDDELDW